jgi:hypothetical protein
MPQCAPTQHNKGEKKEKDAISTFQSCLYIAIPVKLGLSKCTYLCIQLLRSALPTDPVATVNAARQERHVFVLKRCGVEEGAFGVPYSFVMLVLIILISFSD